MYTKLSDIIGTKAGSISIKADGVTKTVDITEDMNVNQFVARLKETGVNASFDETNGRFFISSKTSGADGDFSLTANDSNGLTALKKLGIYTVNITDSAEYSRLAALTEGSDEYNAELESMYTKVTAENVAKGYADKYNAAKQVIDAISADDTWDKSISMEENIANSKDKAAHLLDSFDAYYKPKMDAEGNEVYFKSNDGEERWTEYEHYENGVISKMIEYSRF